MQDDPLAPFGAGETFAKFPQKPEKTSFFVVGISFSKEIIFCGNRR